MTLPRARFARTARSLALMLAGFLVVDLLVAPWLLREGRIGVHALPPHGTTLDSEQWGEVRRRRAALDNELRGATTPFDAELGWVALPQPPDANPRRFNALAARGPRDYADAKPAGALRIVSFGDSFTYGAEVPWDASWQAQLEMLESEWEVPNFGVNGYGTDQALLRFRRVGALDADVVCIGLMLDNIGRNVNRYKPCFATLGGSPAAKPRFTLENGALEVLPTDFASERELLDAILDRSVARRLREHEFWADPDLPDWLWHSTAVRLGVLASERGRRNHRTLWLDANGEPLQLTLAILESFHREALAAGARAAPVLIWPSRPDLTGALARGDRYWQAPLVDALAARGIPCLDLALALGTAANSNARNVDPLFENMHLSRAGNAVVAREVQRWIRAQGLAPR